MKRIIRVVLLALAALVCGAPAYGQQVNLYCNTGTGISPWAPCSSGNPLAVSGTFTPSGSSPEFTPVAPATATATRGVLLGGQYDSTQKTLTDGQQAAVSVSPRGALFVATGADTFTVTGAGGTFPVTQSTSPWIVAGGGTAGSAATGVLTIQGIASMTPVGVSAASGAYASGSIASGAVASGAFASGAVASGAYASGSLASGAMVDLVALSAPVAPATATATKSALGGCQATTAAVNPTTGQQAACSADTNNNLLVSAGGAPNIATSQASVTTGNISVASARALRRAITITNVTGTSAIYCGNTGVATTTGTYLGATAGSSITLNTTAAVFCTVAATTQTVTAVETF